MEGGGGGGDRVYLASSNIAQPVKQYQHSMQKHHIRVYMYIHTCKQCSNTRNCQNRRAPFLTHLSLTHYLHVRMYTSTAKSLVQSLLVNRRSYMDTALRVVYVCMYIHAHTWLIALGHILETRIIFLECTGMYVSTYIHTHPAQDECNPIPHWNHPQKLRGCYIR